MKSVWPGGWGRYLILLTAPTRESQLLGERLSPSSQLALASLFRTEEEEEGDAEVHLAQGPLTLGLPGSG